MTLLLVLLLWGLAWLIIIGLVIGALIDFFGLESEG